MFFKVIAKTKKKTKIQIFKDFLKNFLRCKRIICKVTHRFQFNSQPSDQNKLSQIHIKFLNDGIQ